MKYLTALILVTFCLCSTPVSAQADAKNIRSIDARINFHGHSLKGSYLFIQYELPYNGMVELHLYNASGEEIWQSQYNNNRGKNRIILRASMLNSDAIYSYTLHYKRDIIRESLLLSSQESSEVMY